ncbi:MAG: DUF5114 domain-containing protein [Dysgonamonadaceae bacterium]|jgi:hypothetical protein|nr:DUF5114 domain-containing protein [Dysgonamonadaceae bacterium]
MKTNIIYRCLSAFIALIAITACEEDGERIYLSGLEENELSATESHLVLSQDNSQQIVLSLVWSKSELTVTNSGKPAPNVLATYMQISTQDDFSLNFVETLEKTLSKAYTGAEINTIAKNLGIESDVSTPLYFRIRSSIGSNLESVFSNVVTVNVTPYQIDMSVGFILDADKQETGRTLASPQSDGIYTGFMGVAGWYNFFLLEGDGTIWGNTPEDGNDFQISSAEDCWNFWFPGTAGCYYVNVNTNTLRWSALLIPALTVSGDFAAEMTFDRPNVKWTAVFNTTSASTLKIKLNANGKQYDATTKTDDNLAVDTPVAFAQDGETLRFANQAEDITITVPGAGEYTLVVDLNNPNRWTYQIVSGSAAPEEVNPYVYLPGIGDGEGNWTFDHYLALYDEDKLAYAGAVNVNSAWGYTINIEKDNWDDKYTFAEGDAYSGTLVFKGENNLPAPEAGLYLMETSLKELTYNLTPVENQIYVVGLHDQWTFDVALAATTTPGIFSGDVTINSASPWGFQIHIDDSWGHYYGGSEGKLYYKGANITDDASLAPGVHRMTIDLINGTYVIE